MTAKTVTFAVQLGSGGFAVAQAVSEALKYRYYDSEVTRQAAAEAGVSPEAFATQSGSSLIERIIMRLGVGGLSDDELGTPGAAAMGVAVRNLESDRYRQFIERVVRTLAGQGEAVIVGHAAQVVLRDEWGVLKVLVVGSADARAERLASEEERTLQEAQTLIRQSDKERRDFFRRTYETDLLDGSCYDLVVNTDHIPLESVTRLIVETALAFPGFLSEENGVHQDTSPTAAEVEVESTGHVLPRTKQQDALRRIQDSLDDLVASAPDDARKWGRDLQRALTTLSRVFDRHVREAEAKDGSLADALTLKPHLARRVALVRAEHLTIRREIRSLLTESAAFLDTPQPDVGALRASVAQTQGSLRRHEKNGLTLLYEAYLRDEGGH